MLDCEYRYERYYTRYDEDKMKTVFVAVLFILSGCDCGIRKELEFDYLEDMEKELCLRIT